MALPLDLPAGDPLAPELDAFVAAHGLADRSAALDRAPAFPAAEYRALGDDRWLGLTVRPDRGGRGLTLETAGRVLHRLAYRAGTAFAKLALQPEFCSVLLDHGGAPLEAEWVRPLVAGRRLVGNHLTEPGSGSDARALHTTARRDGDEYVLRGTKSEAAFAVEADAAIVYARVGEAPDGITAFLVPQQLPGIERRAAAVDLGERWQRRGSIEYRDVRLPSAYRLGEEGAGFAYVRPELTRERALLAAIYLGVARASWEETVGHVGGRLAFGRPLADQEAVSFPLVEDGARLDAAALYVERTLRRLDRGEEAEGEAALAKWLATETALTTLDHAVQFHGGRGYSSELPHERRWRDVRSGAIAHGPAEVMHVVAARRLWPRRPRGDPA